MTIQELTNNSIFKLPLTRSEEDFPNYIEQFLNNYLSLIKHIEGNFAEKVNERYPVISELCNHLKESIHKYFIGHIPKSYDAFNEGVSAVKDFLWLDNPNFTVTLDDNNESLIQEFFYKARISHGRPLSKKEMFIRPFEQREDIHTFRYSIPGLPCLYRYLS